MSENIPYNLHKYYYSDYFENLTFELVGENKTDNKKIQAKKVDSKKFNEPLLNACFIRDRMPDNDLANCSFSLKTLYPGLITGIGINHEAGIEGEFKLGMHFDYTHGMPVIYGSSIKGVLRSYFLDFAKNFISKRGINITKEGLESLLYDIFEGKISENEYKPIYERDVFFDAVISGSSNENGKILASDTFCPHGADPLRNPTPISFVKIASNVCLEFRFSLVDSIVNGINFKAEDKKELFKLILTTVGVGAKTNVGYGQLE